MQKSGWLDYPTTKDQLWKHTLRNIIQTEMVINMNAYLFVYTNVYVTKINKKEAKNVRVRRCLWKKLKSGTIWGNEVILILS